VSTAPRFTIPEDQPRERGRGCLFYGCATLIVLAGLAAIGLYLAYRAISGVFRQYVEQYTAAAPLAIAPVNVPAAQRQEIVDRARAFRTLVDTPPGANGAGILTDRERTLELSAEEINVLLEEEEKDLKGRARVEIAGDKLTGEISLPLGDRGMLRGRYLNGRATIVPTAVAGRLQIRLRDIEVKGQPLPKELREAVEPINWMPEDRPDTDLGPPVRDLEEVEVTNGKLRIVFAREPNPTARAGQRPGDADKGP
jgi:hypothetical protein